MKRCTSQERIKQILEEFEINQNEFSRRTGLHKSTVSLFISGKNEPKQDSIYLISKAFDIDPAWVMGFDVPMHRMKQYGADTEMMKIANDLPFMEKIKKLYNLSEEKQAIVFNQIDFLYDQGN